MNEHVIRPVAVIHTDFKEKFGIPRQSTLVPELTGVITFEKRYRTYAAINGIEEYSHLWLLWGFSKSVRDEGPLTVCPPRLGGKVKRGVFATRSPYRPNSIGLSCVKLEQVIPDGDNGPILIVSGIDMLDGTPIYDIKPYMPYSDSFPEADGGFGQRHKDLHIDVIFPKELLDMLPEDKQLAALHLLQQDPRAAYNKEPGFVFGMEFAGFDIRFTADNDCLTVCEVIRSDSDGFSKVK